MTWYLAALAAAVILFAGGGWLLLHEPRHEAAALDHDLDALEVHQERQVRDLRGLAGTSETRDADLRAVPDGPEGVPAELAAADGDELRSRPRVARKGAASSLTPAQRRRAVHKGRLPRNLPGPVSDGPAATTLRMSADASTSRAGELHHDERLPAPLTIWDHGRYMPIFPTLLESAEYEARFRHDWGELGRLRREAWAWWGAPGRWDLAA